MMGVSHNATSRACSLQSKFDRTGYLNLGMPSGDPRTALCVMGWQYIKVSRRARVRIWCPPNEQGVARACECWTRSEDAIVCRRVVT